MTTISVLTAGPLLALATAMQPANAAGMNFYDQCLLVPYVQYTSTGEFSSVGISARDSGTVYWQFRTAAGDARDSGSFAAAANTLTDFSWSAAAIGSVHIDQPGSLLFCIDRNGNGRIDSDDGDSLTGNALLIDLDVLDVAFLPTASVDDDDLIDDRVNMFDSNVNLVRRLSGSAVTDDFLDLQYLVDGTSGAGDETRMILWTSSRLESPRQRMTLYNRAGLAESVDLDLPNLNLQIIDPESIQQLAGAFLGDGFLRWKIPDSANDESLYVFAFSIVASPSFGATQTVLGNY